MNVSESAANASALHLPPVRHQRSVSKDPHRQHSPAHQIQLQHSAGAGIGWYVGGTKHPVAYWMLICFGINMVLKGVFAGLSI